MTPDDVTVVVIAKECLPGKAKTRLAPALGYDGAARVASASLTDTIATVRHLPAARRVLLYDGVVLPDGMDGWSVVPQSTGDLDERLATMFDAMNGPTLLVGMDTPQLAPVHVAPVLTDPQRDAWFGPASDGGFWGLYLRDPRGDLIRGVPMSRDDTGAIQLERLRAAGLDVGMLDELLDVDTIDDAHAVAAEVPASRFSRVLHAELRARADLLEGARS